MILVTGANGYVGRAVVMRLVQDCPSAAVIAAVRRQVAEWPQGCRQELIGDIDHLTDWTQALRGADVVVHCAARVHVMNETSADPIAEFRKVNVDGTANLARQAVASGVRRLVYLSSVKVNGESTESQRPFTAEDQPFPQDPYGVSKFEAEQVLRQTAAETGLEVVIIRPPLVYGPGVKANFAAMMRWLVRGIPLPLAAITFNRRSLVALDNLVDLIVTCLHHPAAAHQTFMVSDGRDLSSAELLRCLGDALDSPARLVHVPPMWLQVGAAMLRKQGVYSRLCGSLHVDISKTCRLLDWCPPLSVEEGLRRAAKGVHT